MTDRLYRAFFGGLLLIGLYFDLSAIIYALVAIAMMEGITNYRIPVIVNKLLPGAEAADTSPAESGAASQNARFQLEAERVWRLVIGAIVGIAYPFYYGDLWFFIWFMGFAILGAGISGICPVLLAIKGLGFK